MPPFLLSAPCLKRYDGRRVTDYDAAQLQGLLSRFPAICNIDYIIIAKYEAAARADNAYWQARDRHFRRQSEIFAHQPRLMATQ